MTPTPTELFTPSRQLLRVVAADWNSCAGTLQCFERCAMSGGWRSVFAPIVVSLGRHGLGWGRGLQPPTESIQPSKQEGDGRAPAGVFAITGLFGRSEAGGESLNQASLPYVQVHAGLKAVDDPASVYYNQIVDQLAVVPDWSSCEDMLREDAQYDLGAVVAHNVDPVVPGAGSCIFMHVWASPGAATAGCTAMALDDLTRVVAWLEAAALPLLVQLPRVAYERHAPNWGLPLLASPPR